MILDTTVMAYNYFTIATPLLSLMISDTAIMVLFVKEKILNLCNEYLLRPLYPQRQHIFAFSIIFLLGYISFYVGINYFDVPRKDAYTTAIGFLGTLSTGYLATISMKRGVP